MFSSIAFSANIAGVKAPVGLSRNQQGTGNMSRKLICLLGVSLLLVGCTLTPAYTRPEAPVPAAWPTGPAYLETEAAADKPPANEIQWREFFRDERLQKVIQTALDNNRDLLLAALNVQRARAVYGIRRADLYPALDATASGSRQRVPSDLSSNGQAEISKRYDVDLGVFSWEIDFFGRIRSLKDRALEEYLATEQARRSTQILIVSAVAEAYLALAADRENVKLAVTTFENQKNAFDIIRRRTEVGIGTELDLRQAQAQVEIARRNIALYTQLVAQDVNTLNLLTGTPSPVPQEVLPEDLDSVKPLKKMSAGLSSEVLLLRPDILAAENRLKAANANIGAARAALFPRISLTTTVGTASSQLSGLFQSGSTTWTVAPLATAPIFDARLWSALDVTRADMQIAVVQYEKAIQSAFREVADALAVRGTVNDQLSAQQALVDALAETYRLTNARYTKGIDSYLAVLVTQRSLYAAQQVLVDLRLANLTSQVQLYAALGGGHTVDAAGSPEAEKPR
jgi:multidrug efflux system outer membrane protein